MFDMTEIQSSLVQVSGVITDTLILPTSLGLAAESASVADLDGDGQDEVVLFVGMSTRVVWVSFEKLTTRPDVDVLKSYRGAPTPQTADGQAFFVAWSEYPASVIDSAPRPRLFSWTRQSGFVDVTSAHPAFVRRTLIPELNALLANEKDSGRRANFQTVIAQLYQESK
jgi:hypothetical protein